MLLSSKYDEGIANVNRKLEDLSAALQTLVESNKQSSGDTKSVDLVHHVPDGTVTNEDDGDGELAYEGESSFYAHSRNITETLGVALASPGPNGTTASSSIIDQGLIQRLLQDVAAAQSPHTSSATHVPPVAQYPELSNLSLPSMSLVLKLLKVAKTNLQRFIVEYQIMSLEAFTALCQKVYFPADEYSIHTWILVNAGLFFLFRDGDGDLNEQLGISSEELQANVKICKTNVDTAIGCLRITVEPSLEACQAIILGASLAMEDAKSALAWKLTALASRMCLDLGLHRLPDGAPGEDGKRKRLTFWYVYAMDKGLSFNFGRTPTIHDYDITVERPTYPGDVDGPWGALYASSVDFAMLQGELYEGLFSVSAQKEPEHVRTQRARALASKIQALSKQKEEFEGLNTEIHTDIADFAVLSADILIQCILAIVYRVIPPPQPAHPLQFCDEAVQCSRSALQLLLQARDNINKKEEKPESWQLFLNWTILFVPFSCFVFVFGNTIAQRNTDDLQLLSAVVDALGAAAKSSPGVRKLHDACSRFTKIAEVLLASDINIQPPATNTQSLDPYSGDFQMVPDFPMSQQDWDGMLNEFDLGLGVESAREMTSYFEPFMSGNNTFH